MEPVKLNLNSPMLIPLLGLIGGIILAGYGAGFATGAALIITGLVIYEIIAWKSPDPISSYRHRNWHYLWLLIVFIGTGTIIADSRKPEQPSNELFDNTVVAYGHVNDISNTTLGDRAVIELTAVMDSSGNAKAVKPFKILGICQNFQSDIDDDIIFPCRINRITDSANTFNQGYALRMARKGILYSAVIEDSIKNQGHTPTLNGITSGLRSHAEEFIEKTTLAKPTQNFLITVLLGDRAYLDENTRSLFSDGGVSHMLALSGMHVSIIAGIIMWLLFPFNLFGIYKWRYIATLPILWGYTLVTGLSPSTVRAAIMLTVVITCILTERKNSAWNALLLAVFIIILFNPDSLYDIGLQLSFICVASLIFFAGPLNPIDQHKHNILYDIVSAILVTLSATAASWVLSSYYFGIFPILFIPANLIVLPLLPIYVVFTLIFFLSVAIGYPVPWLDYVIDTAYSGLTRFLMWLQGTGSSTLQLDAPWITVALWLLALAGLVVWMHYKRHKAILTVSLFFASVSIVLLIFRSGVSADGFIIQTRSDRPQILVRDGRHQYTRNFETNAVSGMDVHGKHIVSADCDLKGSSILKQCDYLIITRSCPNTISEIDSILHPATIILHPSIPRKRESEFIHIADSLNIASHSLRISGPLRIMKSI